MLHAKLLKSFLLFFLSCLSISAQDFHQKIRGAVQMRDYQTAVNELQNLERTDKKIFTLNNYDYLLARVSERRGDFATAMANYQTVVNRNSVLSEYALWHLARVARSSGNLMLERIYLQRLLTFAPDSLLKDAANARMARSFFESKDFEAAIQLFSERLAVRREQKEGSENKLGTLDLRRGTNSAKFRETQVYLGQSFLQLGKLNEAREVFNKLVANLPNAAQPDDFALAAARELDKLDVGIENFGKLAPQIADAEHLQRAFIYQFNRDFADARLHYIAIVERFPASPNVPDAMYQIGRGFVQERNFDEAIKWFERVQAEFPEHPIAQDALSQSASAYSRVNKPKEAISRYQKFIEKYADTENIERAYLNIVDVLRDTGEESDALKWTAKTREVFRGELPETLALFSQARIHIARNDWANALNDLKELENFSDLGGTRVPGGTNKNEITFLKGFVLENLNRYAEAVEVYLSIPDGRNEYYGWHATERLKILASDEKAKPFVGQKINLLTANIETRNAEAQRRAAQDVSRLTDEASIHARMLEIIRKSYQTLPDYQKIPSGKLLEFGRESVLRDKKQTQTSYHQTLADELLFLGLYDEGAPELETALREKLTKNTNSLSDFPADTAYTLAIFYKRGDWANRATAYIEPLWRNIPADYQIELIPREQIEMLYPAPYADSLLKYAPEKNLDPRFALAIMRQESRFRADVKSVAAARGLMQFISSTSNQIANELGRQNFKQDELYNPPTAILFGSQYLLNLFRQFPNQPPAVAAAYNGGEINMSRWLARSKSYIPDRYVPEIIFSQSKDYVYKVMANYRVYQMIYDEKLKTH